MVEIATPYGSCSSSHVEGGRKADALAKKMMGVSGIVLLSTIVVVALVHSISESNTVVLAQDVAQKNLDRSDQLLSKVNSLLAQEQKISTAVKAIESAPLLADGAASAAAGGEASAAAGSVSGGSAASGAASGSASAIASSASVSSSSSSSVSSSSSSSGEKEEDDDEKEEEEESGPEAEDRRAYYGGFVGGAMSDQDSSAPPLKPEQKPGVFDETKKARFVMIAAVFICFVVGSFVAVRSFRASAASNDASNGSSSAPSLPPAYAARLSASQVDLEYGGSPSSNLQTQSTRDKLAAVQEQHAAARRQLAEQQQRLALAQSQLSQHIDA